MYMNKYGIPNCTSNFERKVTSINNFITKTSNTKLTGNNRPGTLYKKGTEKNILILRNN